MTDGRMAPRLRARTETKEGKPVETLNIEISDEEGTRPYESFSGGEAFRINLALRIAISKLLARRAGAPLSTLFIDEGFGSQDGNGREKIVEVLRRVMEDFRKIIVITHMDELKDEFESRIEVERTPRGSKVRVLP